MTVAAVVIDDPSRRRARAVAPPVRRRPAPRAATPAPPVTEVDAALASTLDATVVVVRDEARAAALPEGVTVLLDESGGAAESLRCAIDWCAREGHAAIVVALPGLANDVADVADEAAAWSALRDRGPQPIAVLRRGGRRTNLVRIDAEAWPLAPLEGPLNQLLTVRPALVAEVEPDRDAALVASTATVAPPTDAEHDRAAVEALLGRPPSGAFRVVVRDAAGGPVVIENAPLLDDGTPMPTRYWLVRRAEREAVGRLESGGGVRQAEAEVPASEIAAAHARYAAERERAMPAGHQGPRPTGGVGGTRTGVKCLHAHLAWYLAGGCDPVGRWTALHLAGELAGAVAAIDCGTNSTRLLITDVNGATLERHMTITRLGERVDDTGELAPAAIERTISCLTDYRHLIDQHGVVVVRAAATSAARDASNAEEFFSRGEAVLGVRPELLSGEEEGQLSYAGATAGLKAEDGPYLVVDLGGGSTELVAPQPNGRGVAVRSLDIGCVRVTERFLRSDPPSDAELSSARTFVGETVAAALSETPALRTPEQMVGVAGTVSTLVALAIGQRTYDGAALHHQHLELTTVDQLLTALAAEPAARRRERPGIEPGRADVIAGGALVLSEVMARLGHKELTYSESDILDGLAADLRDRQRRRAPVPSPFMN